MSEFTILFHKKTNNQEGILTIFVDKNDTNMFFIKIRYSPDSTWSETKLNYDQLCNYLSTFVRSIAYGNVYKENIQIIALFMPITSISPRKQRHLFYHMFNSWLCCMGLSVQIP